MDSDRLNYLMSKFFKVIFAWFILVDVCSCRSLIHIVWYEYNVIYVSISLWHLISFKTVERKSKRQISNRSIILFFYLLFFYTSFPSYLRVLSFLDENLSTCRNPQTGNPRIKNHECWESTCSKTKSLKKIWTFYVDNNIICK